AVGSHNSRRADGTHGRYLAATGRRHPPRQLHDRPDLLGHSRGCRPRRGRGPVLPRRAPRLAARI
ncbi:MAG: hypothetical protein AVDCRST_MAG25-609, partial [uncultured Rubrobacteraceae bacterium]